MSEFAPVTTVRDLMLLDASDIDHGYAAGIVGDPEPGSDRSRAYWHGWCVGMVDGGHSRPSLAQLQLHRSMETQMTHALSILKANLDAARNNEPINRSNGNTDQADLELEVIRDVEAAIATLTGAVQRNIRTDELALSTALTAASYGGDEVSAVARAKGVINGYLAAVELLAGRAA